MSERVADRDYDRLGYSPDPRAAEVHGVDELRTTRALSAVGAARRCYMNQGDGSC